MIDKASWNVFDFLSVVSFQAFEFQYHLSLLDSSIYSLSLCLTVCILFYRYLSIACLFCLSISYALFFFFFCSLSIYHYVIDVCLSLSPSIYLSGYFPIVMPFPTAIFFLLSEGNIFVFLISFCRKINSVVWKPWMFVRNLPPYFCRLACPLCIKSCIFHPFFQPLYMFPLYFFPWKIFFELFILFSSFPCFVFYFFFSFLFLVILN